MMALLNLVPVHYRLVAIMGAFLAAYGAGWFKGHSSASRACQTATLRAEVASLKRDIAAADEAAKSFKEEADRNAGIAAENQKIIDTHKKAMTNARPPCLATPLDDSRMRRIR